MEPVETLYPSRLEVFATDLDGDDLLVGRGGGEAPPPDVLLQGECLVVLTDQAVYSDDKMVTIRGDLLSRVQVVRYPCALFNPKEELCACPFNGCGAPAILRG